MRISIDISGQVQQMNFDSSLGAKRSDGMTMAVVLPRRTKKAIVRKYKGQITNLMEKIHCIMIYYCIRDHLKEVDEISICRDVKPRVIKPLLSSLFKEYEGFSEVKITFRESSETHSNGHWPALKAFRKRKYAKGIIKKEMIEKKLLDFKL